VSSNREPFRPRASQYLIEQGYHPEYPDGQPFAVCLTHDIDGVYRSVLSKGYATLTSLKNGDLARALANARQVRSKKVPLCNFKEIMAIEEEYGARSSFYFLALAPGNQDYTYDVRVLEEEIGMIADAGWEVGLHGGHRRQVTGGIEIICQTEAPPLGPVDLPIEQGVVTLRRRLAPQTSRRRSLVFRRMPLSASAQPLISVPERTWGILRSLHARIRNIISRT